MFDPNIQTIIDERAAVKQAELDLRKKEQDDIKQAQDLKQRTRLELLTEFEKVKFKKESCLWPVRTEDGEGKPGNSVRPFLRWFGSTQSDKRPRVGNHSQNLRVWWQLSQVTSTQKGMPKLASVAYFPDHGF